MNKRILFLTAAILLLTSAAFSAGSKEPPEGMPMIPPGPHSDGPDMPPSILGFASELDLTGAQMKKLVDLERASSIKIKKLREDIKKYMDQLRAESEKDSPDIIKVDEIIARLSENHGVFMKQRFLDMQEIKKVLSKVQQKKFKELMRLIPGNRPPEEDGQRP